MAGEVEEIEKKAARERCPPQPVASRSSRAEAFSAMLSESGGSSKAVVNYHVRLEDWSPKVVKLPDWGLFRSQCYKGWANTRPFVC